MRFYKEITDGAVTGFFSNTRAVERTGLTEITQEEYDNAIAEMQIKLQEETAQFTEQKDMYIRELENENAGLLYRLLTGEELTDA